MRQQIAFAFAHRERPESVTTVEVRSSLRDDALQFEGLDWTDVTAENWARYGDAFFGFSPQAFTYFLPSVLSLSLDQTLGAADALINALDTSGNPDIWDDWFSDRFRSLTLPELSVLQEWAAVYLAGRETGEGSTSARVQETLAMLRLALDG